MGWWYLKRREKRRRDAQQGTVLGKGKATQGEAIP